MVGRPRVYFAHPISLYHSLAERVIVEALVRKKFEVVNPSEAQYQRAFEASRSHDDSSREMEYWLKLAETCDACVFAPLPENHIAPSIPLTNRPRLSAGVVKEVNSFLRRRKRVWWTLPDAKRPEEVHLRPCRGLVGFKKLTAKETEAILMARDTTPFF